VGGIHWQPPSRVLATNYCICLCLMALSDIYYSDNEVIFNRVLPLATDITGTLKSRPFSEMSVKLEREPTT